MFVIIISASPQKPESGGIKIMTPKRQRAFEKVLQNNSV